MGTSCLQRKITSQPLFLAMTALFLSVIASIAGEKSIPSRAFGASRSVGGNSRVSQHTDVLALNGGLGGAETQTNVLVPSPATLARAGRLDLGLAVEED